jgi:hypothetical protein
MKQGRNLLELYQELQRQADAKRDFLAPASHIHIHSNGYTALGMEAIGDSYAVNDIAHSQLAEYAGVPKPFYDRLRGATNDLRVPIRQDEKENDENPDYDETPLFDVLLNRLLQSKGEDRRLVRTLDGKARAFLSDSFNVDLDNYDVYRVAARVIEDNGLGANDVVSAEVTERRLYLKVVSPRLQAVIQPENIRDSHGYLKEPQVVQAGFVVSNSEIGLGSLAVQQVVVKLMCTNLWIVETPYRQRHVGKALEADEDSLVYRSDTREADAKARLLKVRDHVAEALDEHKFLALTHRMQETTAVPLSGKIDKVVELTARRFGLNAGEQEDVMRNLIEGADLSLWGLTNAISATAERVPNYDRATEIEAIGGRFFTLPTAELRELAIAA